ncbi:MAG: hypothetical protein KZQ64_03915 [gamma proteobacterium symbiont of Bathyaustriella thionipta]|nr:hypothetical protein [gamma proteobacterium symbiont of Bathyaustriella thionipta]MCU7949391.1 hypothetical protein [gamma proteobacterium symbiont of Bathyaustriella thionipta]MCU7952527.1 hypothetical protein [gamma proteobacterium symbiont of Bathyaustriella thionipta]MCU7955965.1 hypothetical protein [gamma proteobacterium symbiont of Bathyaustriella thionipta]MCU7968426.1 hypothetical protein [gamma proteobacterium symbiont of Bathyaustriella thionipta]
MAKPILKAPSHSVDAQIAEHLEERVTEKNKSKTIMLILSGIIICLLLIIISLVLTPSPVSVTSEILIKKDKTEKQIIKQKKQVATEIIAENKQTSLIKKIEKDPDNKKKLPEKELKLEEITLVKDFNKKINDVLAALEKNKIRTAKKSIRDAEKKPDDPIIQELKERINIKLKKEKIRQLLKQADQNKKKEQWESALNKYEEALIIDENINTVMVKKQRVKNYIKINGNYSA